MGCRAELLAQPTERIGLREWDGCRRWRRLKVEGFELVWASGSVVERGFAVLRVEAG